MTQNTNFAFIIVTVEIKLCEAFGENNALLRRMVQKLSYARLCAFFSGPPRIYVTYSVCNLLSTTIRYTLGYFAYGALKS